jgi:putative transposase
MKNDRSKRLISSVDRITEFDRVIINDEDYVWDCDYKGGKVFIEKSGSHRAIQYADAEIKSMLDSNTLLVVPGFYTAKAAERRGVSRVELLNMLQKNKLARAMYRLTWVELYLHHKAVPRNARPVGGIVPLMEAIRKDYLQRNKESERANNRKVGYTKVTNFELKMPSAGSIRTWVERYREAESDISGLIDRHVGDRSSKFTDEERNLHARFVLKYASTTKPSIAHLHRRMVAAFDRINRARGLTGDSKLRTISETWLAEKIDQLPDFFKMAGRQGSRKARMHFQAVRKGMDKGVPLQRVEADEWTVDLHTLLVETCVWQELSPEERRLFASVRLTFSGVICVATKCVIAFRVFESSGSIDTAYATLDMTARDKTNIAKAAGCRYPWEMRGRFGSIGLDSATWFVSDSLKASLLDSGCSSIYPPSGEPYLRGTIERFFRTIAFLGLQEFSGRTFSNVVEKGDADPQGEASIRKDQLVLIFIRLIVDVYHNTPHGGLGGLTPRRAWLEMTRERSPVPPPTGFMLRNIYGVPATRKITKAGLCFEVSVR